ncbi:MAG TPA: hypothetical protein VGX03_10175 [Candidatus Binatia bacterium]|jgi:hypothetical protein|nr:hypothetical protein [Candidatus Binatia bacterium]
MSITLPPDIEQVLVEHARKQGTTPELLALDSLRERFMPSPSPKGTTEDEGTLADFLSAHIGILHSSEHVPRGGHGCRKTAARNSPPGWSKSNSGDGCDLDGYWPVGRFARRR